MSGPPGPPGGPERPRSNGGDAPPADEGPVRSHARMMERRAVVARQAGRRRLRIVVATLGVAALGAGLFGLAHSPLISVRTVRVTGAVHTTRAEILAASGLGRDPPLADVNTLADAHAIERLPWVRTTSVSVSFPSSVRVVVTERRVVAAARRGAASVALLDVTGRVLADASRPPAGIVSLVGLVDLPAPGGSVRGAGALLAAAAALPAGLESRVTALSWRAGLGIVADLHAAPRAILGSTVDLREKFVALATVLAEVSLQSTATIDLRAPSDPVLTP